jgi:hypothetical protein
MNLKIYILCLFIFYSLFLLFIYNYICLASKKNDNSDYEFFSDDSNNSSTSDTSFIYLKIKPLNPQKIFIAKFYNKKYFNYMNLRWDLINNKFLLLDPENKIIGKMISEKYNKYIIESTIYPQKKLYFELYNNYENVKMHKESSNDIFYLKKNKIYLHALHIGKINDDKIIVYKEYKEYLNLFALGSIIRHVKLEL